MAVTTSELSQALAAAQELDQLAIALANLAGLNGSIMVGLSVPGSNGPTANCNISVPVASLTTFLQNRQTALTATLTGFGITVDS